MDLTLLNINVWHGLFARTFWRAELLQEPAAREKRIGVLIEAIRELGPDVIALQECFPQPAFGRRIAAALGYEDVSRVSNAGLRLFGIGFPFGVKTGEGLSILAKPGLGLRSLGGRNLSGFGWSHGLLSLQPVQKRCALAAEVTKGGKTVAVLTSHLRYEFSTMADLERAWRELAAAGRVPAALPAKVRLAAERGIATRDRELRALEQWCAELEARVPLVIAADLNLDDEAPALIGFVERLKAKSVLGLENDAARTWDPVRNTNVAASAAYEHVDGDPKAIAQLVVAQHDRWLQRPDHILLGPQLVPKLIEARVVLDQPRDGLFPSDHYGIWARLSLE